MLPTIHNSIDKNKFAAEWIAETFFTGSDMPIPDVLSGQEIYRTFWWHDALFGEKNGVVYDTQGIKDSGIFFRAWWTRSEKGRKRGQATFCQTLKVA